MNKVLLFGDSRGIPQLLRHFEEEAVAGIVAASIRPEYIDFLQNLAGSIGVSLYCQPKYNSAEYGRFVEQLRELRFEQIWSSSYSMILRPDVLALGRSGCFNVHYSLLPRNRGCHPVQWALIRGDSRTGVSLHEMQDGIDEGPVIDQIEINIAFSDDWRRLMSRLDEAADTLLSENVQKVVDGRSKSVAQDSSQASIGPRRIAADGEFSWSETTRAIFDKVRALIPPCPPAFFRDPEPRFITEVLSLNEVAELKQEFTGEPLFRAEGLEVWSGEMTKRNNSAFTKNVYRRFDSELRESLINPVSIFRGYIVSDRRNSNLASFELFSSSLSQEKVVAVVRFEDPLKRPGATFEHWMKVMCAEEFGVTVGMVLS